VDDATHGPLPAAADQLLRPGRLWTRPEMLALPSSVPAAAGVYAWYFRQVPAALDARDWVTIDDLTLLYVGISPRGLRRTARCGPADRTCGAACVSITRSTRTARPCGSHWVACSLSSLAFSCGGSVAEGD
jgi:hypothetical protein